MQPQFSPHRARVVFLFALMLMVPALARAPGTTSLHASAAPQEILFQPDATNGTDASIFSLNPSWNFGNSTSLAAGPNSLTGDTARSLLSFGLSGLPTNAVVVNATLSLYGTQGVGGSVQVRRLTSPWTEGGGGHSWSAVPVTVRETAGVNRTLEPVGVTILFAPNSIVDPARDLRVYASGVEIPSQVGNENYVAGRLASAEVFFDVSLGAYQSRAFTVVYSTNGTAVPAYRTRTFSASPIWFSGATGGGASGATIADIDEDGRLEIVFGGADGFVYCLDDHGSVKWRTLVSLSSPVASVPFTPQVADLDHTGRDSIIVVTNDPSVVRLNSTGALVWRYNATSLLFTGGTLVDVNGDGVPDVLVGGNMKQVIAIDGQTGALLPTQFAVGGAGFWPSIVDLDGSGSPEVVFDGYDKNLHAYNVSGTQLWANAPAGTAVLENAVGFADLNGNGVEELVSADFGNNGDVFALYASNSSVAWSTIAGKGFVSGLAIGDLNGDGKLETVMGDFAGSMYAFRSDGRLAWPSPYSGGSVPPGSPALVDLAGNGHPNVIFLEDTALLVLDGTGALVHGWTVPANNQNLRGNQYPMTNPAIADLTGNGTLDIVVPTGNGVVAYSTGGLDYDWRTWGYNLNHTQRRLDGASGTGAPLLTTTVGQVQVFPAAGVSWNYEDGVTPWSLPGGDFGPAVAGAVGASGWMSWNVTSTVQDWLSGVYPNRGLILTEASEVSGTFHSWISSDSPVSSERPMLAVTYISIAGNTPPLIVGRIPDVSRLENSPSWSIDLKTYAYDNSTPLSQLRWNVTGFDPSAVQITGLNVPGNSILTIQPQPNRWGDNHVTYWLSDPQGRFARQDAWINITHVNQPPTFNPPSVLYVRYNQTYTFDFGPYISDPDTPRALMTLASDDTLHAPVSGFNVSFTYPLAYLNAWVFVNLTVSDGEFTVTRVIAIQVTSDYPPVVNIPLPDVTLYEGQTLANVFNLANYFSDPNQDALFFSTGYTHVNVTIYPNLSVDIRAPLGWWGQDQVTFQAKDPAGAIAQDTILATVIHLDQPPTIGILPDLRVRFDSPYSFNLDPYLSDPDTPSSQLLVTVSDPHVFVSGHLITLLYPASFNNTIQAAAVSVSDGMYTVSRGLLVSIGWDSPPSLIGKMPDRSFLEGTVARGAYNLSQYFADADGSVLYWSSGNRSVLVTIYANGSVDLSARANWWGVERVTFRATDSQGALQEDSVWIRVVRVDDAPFFLAVPTQYVNASTVYVPLTRYLGDPDDNVSVLFLAGTNSTHAMAIGQGLLFNYSQDTMEWVRVTLSDGNLTNTTTFLIVVALPPPGMRGDRPGLGPVAPLAGRRSRRRALRRLSPTQARVGLPRHERRTPRRERLPQRPDLD